MYDAAVRVLRVAQEALGSQRDPRSALREIVAISSSMGTAQMSEARVLRNIIATIPHFVFWKDRNSVYQGANAAFAGVAGFDDPSEIAGKTDYDLPWKKEEADFFVATDQRVMREGSAELGIIEPQKQADGRDRYLETSKVPLHGADGKIVGILGMFQDVTERLQMEQDLRDAKEAAEASDRAKSDFLAAMSHELRTPLTLILGPMESLLQDPDGQFSPAVLQTLRRSHRNACRLKTLTDDLLDFSKGQAGLLAVEAEWMDLAQHVGALVTDMQEAASAQGIDLTFETELRSLRTCADAGKVDKMLMNLVGNALKFTPRGGRIEVRLTADEQAYQLSVADTGIGIDPKHHERLFQRFVQVDGGSTRKYGGTGLGLALVKQFCELMSGSVRIDSVLGGGSTFTLTLPRATERDASDSPPASGPAPSSTSIDARRRTLALQSGDSGEVAAPPRAPAASPLARLLIAEDNPDLRVYVASLFESEYSVQQAENGARALELARRFKPDVVLSDVMMPEMDGFELIRHLRADEELKTTPIIVLTARTGSEASALSLDAGADDYVSKPFNPLELRARVRAARRLQQLNADLLQARAQAAETERLAALGRVLAKLSHEINNPVNVITNSADSLKDYARATLTYADACAERLSPEEASVLAELREQLDWSFVKRDFPVAITQTFEAAMRIQDLQSSFRLFLRGEHALAPEPGDLDRAVLASVEQARWLRRGVGRIEYRPGGVDRLCFDRHRLGQALLNVIKNAAEAAGDGGVVWVETRDAPEAAEIVVSDDGPGISAEAFSKMFEPFFTTKDVGSGTGLGLAIGREVIERHGGSIAAINLQPRGAQFTIRLPKAQPPQRRAAVDSLGTRPQ